MAAFTAYAGLRHIRVLPYNAPANGKAESSVKRVQELLLKHCRLLDNWADTLPMVCFALNTAVHSSLGGVSPFFALFGRHPIMIPELEDPSNYRATFTGPDYLRNLVAELRRAWDTVKDASETVRSSVISRGERSRAQWAAPSTNDSCAGIQVGDWVLLKHGSDAHAKIRRKHGYPAYRRFRVVKVMPESNALEIDTRKVNIQPVVSIRQCKRAPDGWYIFNDGSPSAGRYEGPLTNAVARGNPHEIGGKLKDEDEDDPDTHQDHCIYPVEWILEAFHSKRKWYYRVLWLGYPIATWESHEDLEACAGEEVLKWMAEARKRFQAKFQRKTSETPTNEEDPWESSVRGADATELVDTENFETEEVETHGAFELPEDFPEEPPPLEVASSRALRDLQIDCTTRRASVNGCDEG